MEVDVGAIASQFGSYCRPVWSWSTNSKGQNACEVAAILIQSACMVDAHSYPIDRHPTPAFQPYSPLSPAQVNDGLCSGTSYGLTHIRNLTNVDSVPVYNSLQMCAACQSLQIGSLSWWDYTANCSSTRFHIPVPNVTTLPDWATMDPTIQDGHFNFSQAYTHATGQNFDQYQGLLGALMANGPNFYANNTVVLSATSSGATADTATSTNNPSTTDAAQQQAGSSTAYPPPPEKHHKGPPIAVLVAVGTAIIAVVFVLGVLAGIGIRRKRRKDRLGVRLGSGSQILVDGAASIDADQVGYGDMVQRSNSAMSVHHLSTILQHRRRASFASATTNSASTHSHSFSSYLAKHARNASSESLNSTPSEDDDDDGMTSAASSDWYASSSNTSYPSSARHAPRDNLLSLSRTPTSSTSTRPSRRRPHHHHPTAAFARTELDPFEDGSDLISLTPSHDAPSSTGANYGSESR